MLLQESPGEFSDASLVCLIMGDDELVEVDCELFDTEVVCQKLVVESLLTLWRPSKQGNKDSIPSPFSISHSLVVVVSCFLSFEGLEMIRFSQSHSNGDLMLQSIARRCGETYQSNNKSCKALHIRKYQIREKTKQSLKCLLPNRRRQDLCEYQAPHTHTLSFEVSKRERFSMFHT